MNSLEQSDAEEALAEWMEQANIENAWKMAPTLVSIGIDAKELECARNEFPGASLSDALSWLDALVSSMQLVSTIEESIGRVTDLVLAVKSYAYEGKGPAADGRYQRQHSCNSGDSRPQVARERDHRRKELRPRSSGASSDCSGLNQIWTNLLDNAIDAASQHGHINVRTWVEKTLNDGTPGDLHQHQR